MPYSLQFYKCSIAKNPLISKKFKFEKILNENLENVLIEGDEESGYAIKSPDGKNLYGFIARDENGIMTGAFDIVKDTTIEFYIFENGELTHSTGDKLTFDGAQDIIKQYFDGVEYTVVLNENSYDFVTASGELLPISLQEHDGTYNLSFRVAESEYKSTIYEFDKRVKKVVKDGKKVRVCAKCGETLDV